MITPTSPSTTPTPARYRKKPVEVDALLFDGTNGAEVARWCGGQFYAESKASDPTDVSQVVKIPTLEGTMFARVCDFVIRGVQGEFYPCKPDIFGATYTLVEEAPAEYLAGTVRTGTLGTWREEPGDVRTFELHRDVDVSGISGTGVVADGAVFPDGTTVVRWRDVDGPAAERGVRPTTVVFPTVEAVEALHGHAGATRLVWTGVAA
ncbi:hypothetical protein JN535_04160 [Cellulosimicrobium cellulans]|uniref:hypothetical protein n=1 Tax=Cellulosimicrobium cellulans TaxID=1710 RepID=UPI0019647D6D|nr:hypothetical protein [Cellulosimicrobium cellulans]MBN0039368.1 hypothetical protein [Cellulosimicrobium cellulans]